MATPVTQNFLNQTANITFADAAAIDAFFATYQAGATFIAWFNAQRDPALWSNKSISATPECTAAFANFWNNPASLFGAAGPTVMQFLCLMSIMINEVAGDLIPIEEKVNGPAGNPPGIAYAFNAIPGLKRSYNTLAGNRTALDLFNDPIYQTAHAAEAMAGDFAPPAAIDPAWGGEAWPAGVSTSTDPGVTGYLQQADFFKFRGRGLIQTTGRPNYAALINYIQAYTGTDPVIAGYATQRAGTAPDTVATQSTNADWHTLFFSGTLDVAREALALHNQNAGNYLALAVTDPAVLNGQAPGSIYRMGLKISGAQTYATTFQSRVSQLCAVLESTYPAT